MTSNNDTITLEDATAYTKHTAWTRDKSTGIRMPIQSSITIQDKQYTVQLFTRLLMHDTLGLKISPFLPKSVVSEQVVEYNGNVEKNGIKLHEFHGRGFKEWSTRTWKNVPLLF